MAASTGPEDVRRLLAVGAMLVAIGGLVLAASALAGLSDESPASSVLERGADEPGESTTALDGHSSVLDTADGVDGDSAGDDGNGGGSEYSGESADDSDGVGASGDHIGVSGDGDHDGGFDGDALEDADTGDSAPLESADTADGSLGSSLTELAAAFGSLGGISDGDLEQVASGEDRGVGTPDGSDGIDESDGLSDAPDSLGTLDGAFGDFFGGETTPTGDGEYLESTGDGEYREPTGAEDVLEQADADGIDVDGDTVTDVGGAGDDWDGVDGESSADSSSTDSSLESGESTRNDGLTGASGDESTAEAESTDGSESDDVGSGDAGETDTGSETEDAGDEDFVPPLSSAHLLGLFAVIVALVIGYVFFTREDPVATLLSLPSRVYSLVLRGLVSVSSALERVLGTLSRWLKRPLTEVPGLLAATLSSLVSSIRARTRGATTSAGGVGDSFDRSDQPASGVSATRGDLEESALEQIRAAFETVVAVSSLSRPRRRVSTPADVARRAVDAGAPRTPVETITAAFRDVEYGDHDPDSRIERASEAHEELQTVLRAGRSDSAETTDEGGV